MLKNSDLSSKRFDNDLKYAMPTAFCASFFSESSHFQEYSKKYLQKIYYLVKMKLIFH